MTQIAAAFAAFGTDPISARRQFKRLALEGDPRAQAAYALMLATGRGGGADPASAAQFYEKAAAQDHAVACYGLAGLYLEGHGVAEDAAVARHWYQRAAELGDRDALWMLGSICTDPAERLQFWRRAAAQGHVGAMTSIGLAVAAGDGVEKHLPKAAEAFLDAATAGDEDALKALAGALATVKAEASAGEPTAAWVAAAFTDDAAEADRLRAVAVQGGHGRACHRLAERVRQEAPEQWLALLEQAAAAGYAEAQHDLGTAYAMGNAVAKDLGQAVALFRQAAAWGRPVSLRALGAALQEHGQTDEAQDEARNVLQAAALGGDAPAMVMYASLVVIEDPIEALRWLFEAADTGHDDALTIARRLVATMTPEAVHAADRQSRTDGSVAVALLSAEA